MADHDYACPIKYSSQSVQESILYHCKLPLCGYCYLAPHQKTIITQPCCDQFPIHVMFKSLGDLAHVTTDDFKVCPLEYTLRYTVANDAL